MTLTNMQLRRRTESIPTTMKVAAIDRFGPASVLELRTRPGPPKFPCIPGVDGAGTVVARGARVRRLAVGDRVYAYEFGNPQGGFHAQFAIADAAHVSRVPARLDLRAAGRGSYVIARSRARAHGVRRASLTFAAACTTIGLWMHST